MGLFADVRPGEAATALLLTATIFFLLLAYYLLKVAREPLILLGGGAEVKSYAAAGQALLMVVFSLGYSAIAKRVSRWQLVAGVSIFFILNLAGFAALARTTARIGVPFYLWVGVFNMSVVAQTWAFAGDVLGAERGKRLFPVLGIGSSVGAVAGAALARALVGTGLGPAGLMATAMIILCGCLGIMMVVRRRERAGDGDVARKAHGDEPPLSGANGFAMVLSDRYLLWLGVLAIVLNAINTTGEYILDRVLVEASANQTDPKVFIGAFKATYFAWVNVVGVALQLFAVSRIIQRLGLARALWIMPVVSILGYSAIAAFPVLNVVFGAKLGENGLDYSLQNTSKQSLWLPTTNEARYKAKQVVDTFLVRVGDITSAGIVALGGALGFGTSHFAMVNVALVACWFGVLRPLTARYRERAASS